ncbi:TPA: phenylphosphate carboxylase subunit delta [Candidatus Micrarchaeota archaeon]|nr:phenylphosphate carboxylase subunit delta [Candidatus Micrarchaeota archaeon]
MKIKQRPVVKEGALEKAKRITYVVIDIHGVLTDGTLYYTADGTKSERFSLHDKLGFILLKQGGLKYAFLTSKISRADQAMAKVYGVPEELLWGSSAKMSLTDEKQKELGFVDEEMAYIGDEMIDLGMMKRAGLAVAPADSAREAMEIADYVTQAGGGRGVLREVAEFILKAQGKWDEVVKVITGEEG